MYVYSILEYMEDNNISDQLAPTNTKGTKSQSKTQLGFLSTNWEEVRSPILKCKT